MGGKLIFFAALTILGLLTAESAQSPLLPQLQPHLAQLPVHAVSIDGVYRERSGFELNCNWTADKDPDTVKFYWGEKEIFFYEPTKENVKQKQINDTENKYTLNYTCAAQKNICNFAVIIENEPEHVLFTAEACWNKDCRNRSKSIVFAEPVKYVQYKNNDLLLQCTSKGVPKPIIVWTTTKYNETTKVNETSQITSWESNRKVHVIESNFEAKREGEKVDVTCCVEAEQVDGDKCHTFTINSCGRFSAPGFYAVLLLIFAFTSKSII